MAECIPIVLVGNNLGERHRYLNRLVEKAHENKVSLHNVENLPEKSPVDRIFKIDLASKNRDVTYITKTLKDRDMLYVSRALKCTWLLEDEYAHVINPDYLENTLFPEMTLPAVNKMKHWLQRWLKNTARCELFYKHYIQSNLKIALPFLWHCTNDTVLAHVLDLFDKITPQHLKCLYENCPLVAKLFIDCLQTSQPTIQNYANNDTSFFKKLIGVLKLDGSTFLDYIEKYYNRNKFPKLNSSATKHVLLHHKNRFNKKPELYTTWFLDIKTVGICLNKDEVRDLLINLAKAEYLSSWFSYKAVEPLIMCLNVEERKRIKKILFVEKSFGDKVKDWPYSIPSPPKVKDPESHIFLDREHNPKDYEYRAYFKRMLKKRKLCGFTSRSDWLATESCGKTLLDKLFDRYRFDSFEHIFYELRKQISAESSSQNRQYMILVLVSKSGGHVEHINALLRFLVTKHNNEPAHFRATIVRSLVRRAFAWRLPSATWDLLLEFARGLGLDGSPADADCREGLHAVILRHLLGMSACDSRIRTAFFQEFSSFSEYSLNSAERQSVRKSLPTMLLMSAESEPNTASDRLNQLLDTLSDYHVPFVNFHGLINAIVNLASRDFITASPLLQRLYDSKAARKQLFKENFKLIQTDQSYLNALRHDINILENNENFQKLLQGHKFKFYGFLRKMAIYFAEPDGLAVRYLFKLDVIAKVDPHVSFARPIAYLAGNCLQDRLDSLDQEQNDSPQKRLAAALRANAHLSRPPLYCVSNTFDWRKTGVKAIANSVSVSSLVLVPKLIDLLVKSRKTVRLAFVLSERISTEVSVFEKLAILRPGIAVKCALRYFRRRGETADIRIWNTTKPIIEGLDFGLERHVRLRKTLKNIDSLSVPSRIKTDYYSTIFKSLSKTTKEAAMPILCILESHLPELNDEFVFSIIKEFLDQYLDPQKILEEDYYYEKYVCLYVRILTKFLLSSRTQAIQEHRITTVCDPFFDFIEALGAVSEGENCITRYIDELFSALKYNRIFLSDEFFTCSPVFERVVLRIQNIFPMEKWFNYYVNLHLTILYYKSIKQSVKHNSDLFVDDARKLNGGVELVGRVFGKYISHEIGELVCKYFKSVRELYKEQLLDYLKNNFTYGKSRKMFFKSIIKGLLEDSNENSEVLAQYIYRDSFKDSDDRDVEKILKKMFTKNTDLYFFMSADMFY